jgi:membrane-associated phospholipid phosphatase
MMEVLHRFDREVFFLINDSISNPFFDLLMPYLRAHYTWIPLYAAILGYFIWRFRRPLRIAVVVLGYLLSFAISDFTASSVIKPAVKRIRPCNSDGFAEYVHLRADVCGQGFSFVSAHATNHMAMALFMILFLRLRKGWQIAAWLSWPLAVSVAQIYVGVHYPIDVICGWILGSIIALITAAFTRTLMGKVERFYAA